HTISNRPSGHSCANLFDRACDLVAENLRRSHQFVLYLLYVRSANPAGGHPDQDFAFKDFRDRNAFRLHPTRPSVYAGKHHITIRFSTGLKFPPVLTAFTYRCKKSERFRAAPRLSRANLTNGTNRDGDLTSSRNIAVQINCPLLSITRLKSIGKLRST